MLASMARREQLRDLLVAKLRILFQILSVFAVKVTKSRHFAFFMLQSRNISRFSLLICRKRLINE